MTLKDILIEERWFPWKGTNVEIEVSDLLNAIIKDLIERKGHIKLMEE